MGNAQFINIVTQSLLSDSLIAEEELGRVLLSENKNSEKKLESIKNALDTYIESTNRIAYWENYISENITIPGQGNNTPQDGDNEE
jgi:hypothetical protein